MRVLLLCSTLLALFVTAPSTPAQTSIGFAEPDRVQNLLDYRLPDWGYRLWDAAFQLGGSSLEARYEGQPLVHNNFRLDLGSNYTRVQESEVFTYRYGLDLSGGINRSHDGNASSEITRRSLDGDYHLNGSADRYLGATRWHLTAGLTDRRRYTEDSRTLRTDGESTETDSYYRSHNRLYSLGAGFGRVRSVVPLLRAERVSERLAALGRSRLADGDVLRLAEVLAAEYGYRVVFDREERRFWDDVLRPVVAAEGALSPFEMLYLMEVLNEDLGDRRQGWRLDAAFVYEDAWYDNGNDESTDRRRRFTASGEWVHNLSLHHQFEIFGAWNYSFWHTYATREVGSLEAHLAHLWNLTDRHLLESRLYYDGHARIPEDERQKEAGARVALTTYIEDRLSLDAAVSGRYRWERNFMDDESFQWNWVYSLGLVYHLDRSLL